MVARRITERTSPDSEDRVRSKLARWKLPGIPAHTTRRVYGRLQALRDLVAPRVAAACFSALWNRWTTSRRFQKRHLECNRCVLGCGAGAEYRALRVLLGSARSRKQIPTAMARHFYRDVRAIGSLAGQ